MAFSFAALIATDDCPHTDEEIFAVGVGISRSVCKACKEIPGLPGAGPPAVTRPGFVGRINR